MRLFDKELEFKVFEHIFTPTNEVWGVYWSHSVRVCPCVTKSYPGHNFKSFKASNFKLHTQIGHIVEKCSVQKP